MNKVVYVISRLVYYLIFSTFRKAWNLRKAEQKVADVEKKISMFEITMNEMYDY